MLGLQIEHVDFQAGVAGVVEPPEAIKVRVGRGYRERPAAKGRFDRTPLGRFRGKIENFHRARPQAAFLAPHLPSAGDANIDKVRQLLLQHDVRIINVDYTRFVDEGMETITFYVAIPPRAKSESILSIADELPEMKRLAIL